MKEIKELSKTFWYVILGISLVLIIVVAIGFGVFANRTEEVIKEEENGGNIVLNYTNNVSGLKLMDVSRTTDAIGMKSVEDGEYFDFSIDIALDNAPLIEYEIAAIKDEKNSTISDDDIRIYLEQEQSGTYTVVFGPDKYTPLEKKTELGSPAGSMVLVQGKKKKSSTEHYRLRMWLSDKSLLEKGNYSIEILVNGNAK